MDLNPLICPQCGGEIHDYTAGQAMATCGYCGTQFYIPTVVSTPPPVAPPAPTFYGAGSTSLDVMGRTFGLAIGVVVVIIVVGLAFIGSKKTSTSSGYSPFASRTASPTPSPTPDPALLRFGGPGNGDGNFDDPTSLALDRNGQIYVSDSSMRVQEFDPTGKYLRTLKIPSTAAYYERAQQIGKILVGGDGKLYVGVGGVIQVYGPVATKAERTIQVAPDYIQDFAIRQDGTLIAVSENDRIETLLIFDKSRRLVKRVEGFHTDASGDPMSPRDVGIEAIRIAVDPAGNIFSLYALGALSNYSLSYDEAKLAMLEFDPNGKFRKKVLSTKTPSDIHFDTNDNFYVSEGGSITKYNSNGEMIDVLNGFSSIQSFAIAADGSFVVLDDDYVVKRAAF